MHGANIVQTNYAGESTGTLDSDMIVEHFYLNIRSFNAVISVSDGVDDDFFPNELRVFRRSVKSAIIAEPCAFLDLIAYKIKRLPYHIKDFSLEHLILNHIHFCADLCLSSVIADKTHPCPRKETLRFFSEKKQRRSAHFFSAVVPHNVVLVLSDVFLS